MCHADVRRCAMCDIRARIYANYHKIDAYTHAQLLPAHAEFSPQLDNTRWYSTCICDERSAYLLYNIHIYEGIYIEKTPPSNACIARVFRKYRDDLGSPAYAHMETRSPSTVMYFMMDARFCTMRIYKRIIVLYMFIQNTCEYTT